MSEREYEPTKPKVYHMAVDANVYINIEKCIKCKRKVLVYMGNVGQSLKSDSKYWKDKEGVMLFSIACTYKDEWLTKNECSFEPEDREPEPEDD